ncbi:hypothetical protein CBR_g38912 [Chara braunii]|uniref:Uncharacterized protein n=1 Tax=Chara braunii TaxID=69332 RepID=A0A388LQL5_CHABU|nr:hypothetical protein CBR_g38912 [Chara braunii]|eukprot:GBG84630.1 hypothetical protein CBR_g38912 [Chara braunii]
MAATASTCFSSVAAPASQSQATVCSRRYLRCAGLAPLRMYSRSSSVSSPETYLFSAPARREKLAPCASLNQHHLETEEESSLLSPSSPSLADWLADEHVQGMVGTTVAATLFGLLAEAGSAQAAQEVMQLAAADNRGFLLLIAVLPALGWVAFNILKPALNQLDKMTGAKAVIGALGLGAAAGGLLSAPAAADAAEEFARLAEAAGGDSRAAALLLPLIPAVGWVVFNILRPGLNQLDKMRGSKGALVGALGLGAAASSFLAAAPNADAAQDMAQIAAAAAADNRPLLVLFVVAPALGWVVFNILKPGLNQLDRMASGGKAVVGAVGLGAATSALFAAPQAADAAQEVAQLAADNRPVLLVLPVAAALGWVLFNILQPALNQLDKQLGKTSSPSSRKKK